MYYISLNFLYHLQSNRQAKMSACLYTQLIYHIFYYSSPKYKSQNSDILLSLLYTII